MAAGPVKILRVNNVTTSVGATTNVYRFKEEHIMQVTPQFIPNLYKGAGVLQLHKWRILTITIDTETNVFDNGLAITAANSPFATTFYVEFTLTDGVVERWTYEPTKCYVYNRGEGRYDAEANRKTVEYAILTYGSKVVTHP